MKKAAAALAAFFCLAIAGCAPGTGVHKLFSNGKTSYSIALDKDASPSERYAAEELQKTLKCISGADFEIVDADNSTSGKRILIGYSGLTAELLPEAQEPQYGDDSFTYCNAGGDILIFGGKKRGSMYGVFSFLEKEFGCRWYTSKVTVMPKKNTWRFNKLYNHEEPGILVRNTFYYDAFDPEWSAHNRNNGYMDTGSQKSVIPVENEGWWGCHTFEIFVPEEKYFKTHPEYFSEIDGKRDGHDSQLCLTNPDVLQLCIEGVKKAMREHPEYKIYDVSRNDNSRFCQCEKCMAKIEEFGSRTGLMVWFINQVADAVKDEFPDKFLGTFAYSKALAPPKGIQVRDNVVIRICTLDYCAIHSLEGCKGEKNSRFMGYLKDWGKIAPHIFIWDYVVAFNQYSAPFPNFYALQPNVKTFRDNNAIGILEQGAYQSPGGEFAELRAYLIARLLWDPDCDVEYWINDFINGYYGKAAKYVRRYFDLAQALNKEDIHTNVYPFHDNPMYSEEFIDEAKAIFEEAYKTVADDPEMLKRVELAALPVYYLRCARTPKLSKEDGSYAMLKKIVEQEGITNFAENRPFRTPELLYEFVDEERTEFRRK